MVGNLTQHSVVGFTKALFVNFSIMDVCNVIFIFILFQIYLYRVKAFSNTTVLPCCPVTQINSIWYMIQ